jgi:hypothetical protein
MAKERKHGKQPTVPQEKSTKKDKHHRAKNPTRENEAAGPSTGPSTGPPTGPLAAPSPPAPRLTSKNALRLVEQFGYYHISPARNREGILRDGLKLSNATAQPPTNWWNYTELNEPFDYIKNNPYLNTRVSRAMEQRFREAEAVVNQVRGESTVPRSQRRFIGSDTWMAAVPNATLPDGAVSLLNNVDDVVRIFEGLQRNRAPTKTPPAPQQPSIYFNNFANHQKYVKRRESAKEPSTDLVFLLPPEFTTWAGMRTNPSGAMIVQVDVPAGYIISSENLSQSARLLVSFFAQHGFNVSLEEAQRLVPLVEAKKYHKNSKYNPNATDLAKPGMFDWLSTEVVLFPQEPESVETPRESKKAKKSSHDKKKKRT